MTGLARRIGRHAAATRPVAAYPAGHLTFAHLGRCRPVRFHSFRRNHYRRRQMPSIAIPTRTSHTHDADLIAHLPRLRDRLEEERGFRIDQLTDLAAQRGEAQTEATGRHQEDLDASADNARIEVSVALEIAARHALHDIEMALRRIQS